MKKILLMSLVVLFGCKPTPLRQAPNYDCGHACYTGPEKTLNVGVCHSGTWFCETITSVTATCINQALPSNEVCDNQDNDCNGQVDESLFQSCKSACGQGQARCVAGNWLCDARPPREETCDGFDNDCDGIIDNQEKMPVKECYSGPTDSLKYGDCHKGVARCENGLWMCRNEKPPTAEVCDGIDNDCNGTIDNEVGNDVDIVFVIDNSCSMSNKILKVNNAVKDIAFGYTSNAHYRFALLRITDSANDGVVIVQMNFNSAINLMNQVATLGTWNGGADEASLDAVALASDYTYNPLSLNWRAGSTRYLIMFADEKAQSYLIPPLTELDVTNKLTTSNLRTYVFGDPSTSGYGFVSVNGGQFFNILADQNTITLNIKTILSNTCK